MVKSSIIAQSTHKRIQKLRHFQNLDTDSSLGRKMGDDGADPNPSIEGIRCQGPRVDDMRIMNLLSQLAW